MFSYLGNNCGWPSEYKNYSGPLMLRALQRKNSVGPFVGKFWLVTSVKSKVEVMLRDPPLKNAVLPFGAKLGLAMSVKIYI